ncbi:hypothetical protein Tsubulata_500585 [Turnera subulata]|uniref:Uncharacterized protein n=1 Tax=Turnera subulata TaxID=218843 RepID=A0A9Q0GJQ1_9ROSI|nr:hypothetical protein Tsubulata_500585 [Turnera subulata]
MDQDLIHTLINIFVAPPAVLALFLFLRPYLYLNRRLSLFKTLLSEDVAGKVVLITGASSGIGEHLAYEYARRGACLALVARREYLLREVAAISELLGSPNAIAIPGDVTKVEDCERFVNATIEHFGRLDHLVANAGVAPVSLIEDASDITRFAPAMDINFWGSVYSTYFAIPHLKRSKGKIIAISSCAAWLPAPRMSFYSASKAAVLAMFETLRIELAPDIGVTIVTPGVIKSEMSEGKFITQRGRLEVDEEMRNVMVNIVPVESAEECAKAIVKGACRGEKYVVEPSWYNSLLLWKVFCPDAIEWTNRFFLVCSRALVKR